MDEQLKTELAQSAGKLLQWAEATSKDADALMREQAPLVAQEIVAMQLWSGVVACISIVIGLVLLAFMFRQASKSTRRDLFDVFSPMELLSGAGIVVIPLSLIGLVKYGYQAIEAGLAPRVVILHELQKLL